MRSLLLVVTLGFQAVFLGCAISGGSRTGSDSQIASDVRRSFEIGLSDLARSPRIPKWPIYTANYSCFWVPASAERIIEIGPRALPILESLKQLSDLPRMSLALSCIAIIGGKDVEK